MVEKSPGTVLLEPATREFYRSAMKALRARNVPFLVGGAYAFEKYTGIERHTKDFDIFVRPADCELALQTLVGAGYQAELTFPHWLGKAFQGDDFVDVIFSSGNGVAQVDDAWFEHSVSGEVLGLPVELCPREEIIWTKAFVQERERFDGADIMHMLRSGANDINWDRLVARFGSNYRVLLSQLIMFGFVYPEESEKVPPSVMASLLGRISSQESAPSRLHKICRGTLLSREQYLTDIHQWGYADARAQPLGNMTEEEVERWTAAIEKNGH